MIKKNSVLFFFVVQCLWAQDILPEQNTEELLASEPEVSFDFYANLERIPSDKFEDFVIRVDKMKAALTDTTLPKNQREFAQAAYFYYTENWDSAYTAYDTLRTKDSALEKSVIIRMAQIAVKKNDISQMWATLELGKKFESDALFSQMAASMKLEAALADSNLKVKDYADSLKVFLDKYPKSANASALKYKYALYLENLNKQKEAKKIYMQLLTSSSVYKDSAFKAIGRLRKVQGKPESLNEKIAYAKMACAKGEAESCISLLDSIFILDKNLLEKNPNLAVAPSEDSLLKNLAPSTIDLDSRIILWERRAQALRGAAQDSASIAQFKFLLDSVEMKPLWIQSILRLYRKDAKKYSAEIRTMDSILQDVSQFSKENANNLWIRGFEYEQKQMYDSAITCYKKLSNKRFKNNVKRQWAKFRIGFIYFKREMWNEAAAAFTEATKDNFLWSGSGARMFLGETYKKMGNDSLAREAFLDCIRDFPLAYYAHKSRLKLAEYNLMDTTQIPYARGVPMTEEQTLAWIRDIQKLGKPDTTYNATRYARIKELFLYGFSDEAFMLYDEVRKKNYKRLDFLYEYGKLFYEVGEIASGYRLARQFQNNIDRRRLMAPPIAVLHYLYPIPFKEQVVYHAGSRIDPFFVYSVMRQESIFNFQIASPVGACGLLQIMPATGKMLAKLEKIENFDPKELYNPYMNIRLGVRYLVDLKKSYADDYMYVLGNYNAGPKPTKRWQKAGEGLPWDIRAEEISYWETRDYVKRVMGNYWIYQEIYDKL